MSHETHGKKTARHETKKKYSIVSGTRELGIFKFSSVLFSGSRGISGREWRPELARGAGTMRAPQLLAFRGGIVARWFNAAVDLSCCRDDEMTKAKNG
jgi:hypothetical protein